MTIVRHLVHYYIMLNKIYIDISLSGKIKFYFILYKNIVTCDVYQKKSVETNEVQDLL